MNKKLTLAFVAMLAPIMMLAQPNGGGRRMVQVSSPVVNADNTVTFNYRNDSAKEVKVNVQFAGTHEMAKN